VEEVVLVVELWILLDHAQLFPNISPSLQCVRPCGKIPGMKYYTSLSSTAQSKKAKEAKERGEKNEAVQKSRWSVGRELEMNGEGQVFAGGINKRGSGPTGQQARWD